MDREDLALTARLWRDVQNQNTLRYPDEHVVRWLSFVQGKRPARPGDLALDVGYGQGRHLRLLSQFGYVANGIDLNPPQWPELEVATEGMPVGELKQGDIGDKLFDNASLRVMLIWGSIFYKPVSEMSEDLRAARSMLFRNGRVAVNFRTNDNWFRDLGKPIDSNTIVLDDRALALKGMTYTFLSDQEAVEMCEGAGFSVESLQKVDWYREYPRGRHSWYILWLRAL